ncbi:MAG: hypothetical protein AB7Q00_08055 [Phycisphaerales bacterium]
MRHALQVIPLVLTSAALAQSPAPPGDTGALDPKPSADAEGQRLTDLASAFKRLASDFDKYPNLNVSTDILALNEGRFGVKYDLDYTFDLGEENSAQSGSRATLQLLSRGLITNDSVSTQDFVNTEIRLSGELFGRDPGTFQSSAKTLASFDSQIAIERAVTDWTQRTTFEEITQANTDKAKRQELEQRVRDLVGRDVPYLSKGSSSRFVTVDGHARMESDQTFEERQYAIGFTFTTDLDVIAGDDRLTRAIDAPFRNLRSRTMESSWVPAPRFSLGYDYVTNADMAWRKALTTDDNYNRLTFEAAWRTTVLTDVQLRFAWRVSYEIDAPAAVRSAGKDLSSYYDFSMGIPTGTPGSAIVISYSHGEIGPTLEGESLIGVGLRVEF